MFDFFQVKDEDKDKVNRDCKYDFHNGLLGFNYTPNAFLYAPAPLLIHEPGSGLQQRNILQFAATNHAEKHCPGNKNATQKVIIIIEV